ncbi:MAG: HEAT repeat domain-containing protein [Lachnospiraceae bacterium]|nr:HEAT repeat domain-containing protein [Lachnospiraceae bacterium]
MIKAEYNEIRAGRDVRAHLITLRELIRDEHGKRELAYLIGGDFQCLTSLLKHEDPKVRRNAALILGEMETEDILPFLFRAYEEETTRFVRPFYLKAMEKLDCSAYVSSLRREWDALSSAEVTEENRKHIREERAALLHLLQKYEKREKHAFTGYDLVDDVVLLVNREQRDAVSSQIKEGTVTGFPGGIRVRGASLKELLMMRTWTQWLLPIPAARPLSGDALQIGRGLAKLNLPYFLDRLCEGPEQYFYRLEIRSSRSEVRKGELIRKISSELDPASGGRLQNDSSDYEIEIRLLEKKDGSFLPMLRLCMVKDNRFAYRRHVTAESIAPQNAALCVQLALPYLQEGAQVLDPFCGVGTMLIERNLGVRAGDMYGIDTLPEAVEGARDNTSVLGFPIHFIHRDFFDFKHAYLFDEIITDMPGRTGGGKERETMLLYERFPGAAWPLLKEGAILVLYSPLTDMLRRSFTADGRFGLVKEYLLNEKSGAGLLIYRRK